MDQQLGLGIPVQLMRDVSNPFKLILRSSKCSSIADGVWLQLTSRVNFQMQLLWGVNINAFYPAVFQEWSSFIEAVESDNLLANHTLKRGNLTRFDGCCDVELHFATAEGDSLELGDTPRAAYPLVVVMTVPTDDIHWDYSDIVAMISVVHLSDDVCPGKSHIITQYIRTVQDQPCNLEQLYVASSETNAAESESNESGTTDREQTQTRHDDSRESAETAPGSQPASVTTSTDAELQPTQQQTAAEEQYTEENGTKDSCIICQCDQVNVVILPCRHTCVCRECLLRLDKCPMCRSFIQSYFTLDGSAGATAYQPQPPAPDENPANSPRWWVNLNQRVNGFLGFT